MLKMTFTLVAALYAGFVVWGEPTTDALTTGQSTRTAALGSAPEFAEPVILTADTATGATVTRTAVTDVVVPDAATIAASAPAPSIVAPRLIGEPVVVSLVTPSAPAAATPRTQDDLYRVSGSRVNMRSGPSTSNAVVDSLPGGTLTEMIGDEANGWVQIRDIASGQTGYMAARFLEPA